MKVVNLTGFTVYCFDTTVIFIILPSKVECLGSNGRMEVDALTELGGEGYCKAEPMVEPSTAISLYSSPPWEVSQKLKLRGPSNTTLWEQYYVTQTL